MAESTMFFIDSSSSRTASSMSSGANLLVDSDNDVSDKILYDSLSSSAPATASGAVGESFISIGKPPPPQLVVDDVVDPKTRKLQHNIDVQKRIYFGADTKSLLATSSKNRIRTDPIGGIAAAVDFTSASSSSSYNSNLVAALLDDGFAAASSSLSSSSSSNSRTRDALAKSATMTADFGRRESIPSSQRSRREKKAAFAAAKESNKGAKWFNMARAEMTEEEKRDLKILKMRKALDPKTFYKGDDMKGLPRFFQKGTVVESKAEFFSGRIPKKQRAKSLADELLADAKFLEYGAAKVEERKKFDDERKKRMRQKKHLQRMSAKKKGKK